MADYHTFVAGCSIHRIGNQGDYVVTAPSGVEKSFRKMADAIRYATGSEPIEEIEPPADVVIDPSLHDTEAD